MDLKYLKKIINIFDESSLTDITIEEEGTKIILSKELNSNETLTQIPYVVAPQDLPIDAKQIVSSSSNSVEQINVQKADLENESPKHHEIKSPIVGTFYKSPSPDSSPFVKVGDKVEVGQTLCIVEAMKLMNEIESDISGTIEKINLNDAEPVEYGQILFHINTD